MYKRQGQSHAAIIARSLNIPGITQVGEDFLKDCDGREVILNATEGCLLYTSLDWLNAYHREVFEKLAPRLTEDERDWLAKKCAAIGA